MLLNLRKKQRYQSLFSIICFLFCLGFASFSFAAPKINNSPLPSKEFVGRKEYLHELNELLNSKHNVIGIVGSGGIGKTDLVRKFAEYNVNNYEIIWWFDARSSLNEQFKLFASNLNDIDTIQNKIKLASSAEELIQDVKEALKESNLKFLLIFDNALSKNKILNYIPNTFKTKQHVIITSRNAQIWDKVMKISKFKREESIKLLTDVTGYNNHKEANLLAEMLDDFPFCVNKAAAYIKKYPNISYLKYIELFKTKRKELWDEEKYIIEQDKGYLNPVIVISLSLEALKNEAEEENNSERKRVLKRRAEIALELAKVSSVLDHRMIPQDLLEIAPKYTKLTEDTNDIDILAAITELSKYFILEKAEISNSDESKYYKMHEIDQLAIYDTLSQKEKPRIINLTINIINRYLPDKIDLLVPKIASNFYLINHINSIAKHAEEHKICNEGLIILYLRSLEFYVSGKRDFVEAEQLINKIEQLFSKVDQVDDKIKIQYSLIKGAYFAFREANFKAAINELLIALNLLDKNEFMQEEYLRVYSNLAQYYSFLGENEKSGKYLLLGEQVIEKSKGYLGNLDNFYHALTKYYLDKGVFDKAYTYSVKCIEETKNTNLAGTFPSRLIQAEILLKQENYSKALELAENILNQANDIYKSEYNYFIGRATTLIANCKLNLGNTAEAKQLIANSLNIYKKIYGENKPNRFMAYAYTLHGDILVNENNYLEAKKQYQLAENIYNKIFTKKEIDDISNLYYKLALISAKLGNDKDLEKYFSRHKKNFGADHPRTYAIVSFLVEYNMPVPWSND